LRNPFLFLFIKLEVWWSLIKQILHVCDKILSILA
jgi:hypothetical protein